MVPLQVHESMQPGRRSLHIEKLIIGGGEIHPSVSERNCSELAAPAYL